MRKLALLFMTALGLASISAHGQDFGLTAGVLDSNASAKSGTTAGSLSTSGDFGFRAGGVVSVPLTDQLLFRSGLIFTQRHFDIKNAAGTSATLDFDYIDIPILAQYNFTENFGAFGGLIASANVNHSGGGVGTIGFDVTGTKGLYPLLQVGVNGTFQNMFGVEAYYEYGLGDICDYAKNFSVFGLNFIYWL